MYYPQLSAASVHALLREGQVNIAPEQLAIERRDGRWLVEWNSNQLAWVAASPEGAVGLAREREVLTLVQRSCSFAAPRVWNIAADGSFDIRTRLEGIVDPAKVHEHLRSNSQAALELGRWIGTALAALHAVITPEHIPHWLPRKVSWPESTSWILERLPAVIGSEALVADIAALLSQYEDVRVVDDDKVLVHTDLGLHNIVFAADSFKPLGIIDFEAAAYADRHFDFRYLVLNFADTSLLTAACEVYAKITGKELQPARILLYNAVSACCYLANRAGILAESAGVAARLLKTLHGQHRHWIGWRSIQPSAVSPVEFSPRLFLREPEFAPTMQA